MRLCVIFHNSILISLVICTWHYVVYLRSLAVAISLQYPVWPDLGQLCVIIFVAIVLLYPLYIFHENMNSDHYRNQTESQMNLDHYRNQPGSKTNSDHHNRNQPGSITEIRIITVSSRGPNFRPSCKPGIESWT